MIPVVAVRQKYSFEDYIEMLRGAGQRAREKILADADQNEDIDCREFKELCEFAYPDLDC